MKVAIYARVSDTKRKSDGDRRQDVRRQQQLIQEHCNRAGIIDAKSYVDDGSSAFTEDLNQRPAFKQLLNDVKRHFVQQIFIEDMTRFSRNLSMGLQWLKLLDDYNCTLTSLKEGEFETTSSQGWFKSTAALMFAEWDSRVKSEKVKHGMKTARNLGKHVGRPKKRKGGSKSPRNLSIKKPTTER